MRLSIKNHIILRLIIASTIVVGCSIALFAVPFVKQLYSNFDQHLGVTVTSFADLAGDGLGRNDPDILGHAAEAALTNASVSYARVYDKNGTLAIDKADHLRSDVGLKVVRQEVLDSSKQFAIGRIEVGYSTDSLDWIVSATYYSIASAFLIFLAVGIAFSYWMGKLSTEPISYLSSTIDCIVSKNSYDLRLTRESKVKEVQLLNHNFNTLLDQVVSKHEELTEFNRNLERLVQERTSELNQKTTDLATMLGNLELGVFTIVPGMVLHGEYSKYLESIFKKNALAGSRALDLLFDNSSVSPDRVSQMTSVLESSLGENGISFLANSGLLVREYAKEIEGIGKKYLHLEWYPEEDSEGTVNKIIVSVKDVTRLRQMEAEAEQRSREQAIILEIIDAQGSFDIEAFLDTAIADLRTMQSDLANARDNQNSPKIEQSLVKGLFVLHTMKGVARTMALNYITDAAHSLESLLSAAKARNGSSASTESSIKGCQALLNQLEEYKSLITDRLGRGALRTTAIAAIEELMARAESISSQMTETDLKSLGSELVNLAKSNSEFMLCDLTKFLCSSGAKASEAIQAEAPDIITVSNGLKIPKSLQGPITDALVHCIANSVSHGIEAREERERTGKVPRGTVRVESKREDGALFIRIGDDGRGLDIAKIWQEARTLGYQGWNDREIGEVAQIVLDPGFSTSDSVGKISGRGVGFSAVRDIIEGLGGRVRIELLHGEGEGIGLPTASRLLTPGSLQSLRSFELVLEIPGIWEDALDERTLESLRNRRSS